MIQRPPHPVVLLLLQQAWRLRLQLSGFQDLEDASDPDAPLRGWRERPLANARAVLPEGQSDEQILPTIEVEAEARFEYYRQLGVESHRRAPSLGPGRGRGKRSVVAGGLGVFPIKKAIDRRIIKLLSEGTPIRDVMARLHVGQDRVYRVLRNVQNRIRRETKHGKANPG